MRLIGGGRSNSGREKFCCWNLLGLGLERGRWALFGYFFGVAYTTGIPEVEISAQLQM